MQWKRDSLGKLSLWIKDPGDITFKPYHQSVIHTPCVLEKSQFGAFEPGFRTAQIGISKGYEYIPTDS